MVIRKPLPVNSTVDTNVPPQVRMQNVRQELWSASDSESDDKVWGGQAQDQDHRQQPLGSDDARENIPSSLRPGAPANYAGLEGEDNVWVDDIPESAKSEQGAGLASDINRVPTVLRPGSGVVVQKMETDSAGDSNTFQTPNVLRPAGGAGRPETNPFKRKMPASVVGGNAQQQDQPRNDAPFGIPPVPSVPIESFSQLSVAEQSKNPWQPALDEKKEASAPPPVPEQDSGRDIWDSGKPSRQPTPGQTPDSSTLISLPSEVGSAAWGEEEPRKVSLPKPLIGQADDEVMEDSHAWDDLGNISKGKGPAPALPMMNTGSSGSGDDWNLIDIEAPPGPPPKQSGWEKPSSDEDGSKKGVGSGAPGLPEQDSQDMPPTLPPRQSQEGTAPIQPPRPVSKSETYQIKNINWHDVTAAKNPRRSPILVQNANGPCPLVALVNALSLTTPADRSNASLVETLRSREHVSLGLLLDAVLDELMSERRLQPDVSLPDVTDLYNFLKGLHTGMNVNPRFIPAPEVINTMKRTSLSHLHPTQRGDLMPGTFESTKEMALYATFQIPLIHGWLPARDDDVYDAFARQAVSYEDAQNMLFREEELEEKLSSAHHQGLTEEEQQIYQDILTMKSFLSISATQLTTWGLETIKKSMRPGSIAILFRNDHFSTLYRHPQTLELLTLVTDAGYANHDEVVWESLVDVNGEHAEFFSGDFRLVGGASHHQGGSPAGQRTASYAAVASRDQTSGGRLGHEHSQRQEESPLSPHEQEDRDLALAMQLQEEEDERHRVEQARRLRESRLSEQFIEQQARPGPNSNAGRSGRGGSTTSVNNVNVTGGGRGGRGGSHTSLTSTTTTSSPAPPHRRSSSAVAVPVTTSNSSSAARNSNGNGNNRPGAQTGLDDAPPSYEQAAKQTAYVPPTGHPSHPTSSPNDNGPPGSSSSGTGGGPRPESGPAPAQRRTPPSPLINRAGRAAAAAAGGGGPSGGGYPGVVPSRIQRQGVPPGAAAGGSGSGGKDRDCVVM
ncbi:hypothetical protein B0T17DRAFT_482228 [Bombardia bombarda]|uniref:MINDY deubiquitinase domain-containing protein n=1 Tax=Bombardia bombarda TaxID=252184 RepID=A0AA40CDL9_9PEZI|nr:hypothetical protein B0T17DRAFT_482228 [Bombardia bombarda]